MRKEGGQGDGGANETCVELHRARTCGFGLLLLYHYCTAMTRCAAVPMADVRLCGSHQGTA